ncbi:FGGY family carbohydrate kinase [Nocardia sp. NPDC019395]|uniref:FGGY-family carbohydrate kinase n=1 Tax=Nocardia sp. NPDC019395 TaxID=3154686 RepID=UPI0033BFC95E
MSRRSSVVLGADVGSTNIKVVALDYEGRVRSRARRATPRREGDPSIDAMELFTLLEDLVIETCGDEFAAAAICVAGVGEDGVLVDADRRPLGRALAWFDPRRQGIFDELESRLPPAEGLGVDTDPARTLVGWAWAGKHLSGRTRPQAWLALTDFASCRWTGADFLSDTLAARTAAWRTTDRTWSAERVRATLGSPDLLPEVRRAGDIVGAWRSGRLTAAGVLDADPVVVSGGHDHPIGGWGVDRISPGAVLDSMGTAEVVVAQTGLSPAEVTGQMDVSPGVRATATTVLRVEELARNVAWAARDEAVDKALQQLIAGDLRPDEYIHSTVFLPGAPGGAPPRYAPDAPADPISRASAVLGALAARGGDAIRDIAALMPSAPALYTAGGWARSPGWIRIKQAVAGLPFTVITEPETTAAGAALLAADALGRPADAALALTPRNPVAVEP